MLTRGGPAPWFTARSTINPTYQFDTVAGRYIVLCFFESAQIAESASVLAEFERHGNRFDVENFCFFGVSNDPQDEMRWQLRPRWPGMIYFWDPDCAISKLYQVANADGSQIEKQTIVLDQGLRVLSNFPFGSSIDGHVSSVMTFLESLPPIRTLDLPAPVLLLPNVFDREFCQTLIGQYESHGGQESGYMREIDGKTVPVVNRNYKRRSDYTIIEPEVIEAAESRLRRCLIPEIKNAFHFDARHIERYLVGCYDAANGGFFKRHRDNTTRGTAHRQLAVTINLNAEEYDGGDLSFPDFGPRMYRGPTGGAIVFSCCLSHQVSVVTRGKRYAFLPFLYNEEGARIREMNEQYLDTSTVRVQM
jgi:peroxiredoxin/predicted 2-oxoglutarate/Fe(II)-dependent dioxygenase YbiX